MYVAAFGVGAYLLFKLTQRIENGIYSFPSWLINCVGIYEEKRQEYEERMV